MIAKVLSTRVSSDCNGNVNHDLHPAIVAVDHSYLITMCTQCGLTLKIDTRDT